MGGQEPFLPPACGQRHPRRAIRPLRPIAASMLALAVAGCGGEGGGPAATVLPSPPAPWATANGETVAEARALERAAQSHLDAPGFRYQWGLEAVNAHQAYARLDREGQTSAPGTGTTLGFIDSGLDIDHPAMNANRMEEIYLGEFPTDEICQHGVPRICTLAELGPDEFSHGTAVASIVAADPALVAAAFPSPPLHGVAPGARVRMLAIPIDAEPSGPYAPETPADLAEDDQRTAAMLACVLEQSCPGHRAGAWVVFRPEFVNLSIGVHGIIENYSEAELRAAIPASIAAAAQADAPRKTVFVWAAGNDHGESCTAGDRRLGAACVPLEPGVTREDGASGTLNAASPGPYGGLMARIPELRDHSIVVVSVRENDPADPAKDGRISDFSNRCGIAADWCIAAPGEDMVVATWDPTDGPVLLEGVLGTSLATPIVTGGLAVMNQVFRQQLTPVQLAARLLDTANRRGIYADRTTYGRGLMDLGAATAPIGDPALASGATVDGPGIPLGSTGIRAGTAFGDGIERSLAGREVAAFDELGAPFWFRLGGLATRPAAPSAPGRALTAAPTRGDPADGLAMVSGWLPAPPPTAQGAARLRFGVVPSVAAAGHTALAGGAAALAFGDGDNAAVSAFTSSGVPGRRPVSGAALSWLPTAAPLGIRAGWIGEDRSLLGTETAGAFEAMSGDTVFAGMNTGLGHHGGWRLIAAAELGVTTPRSRGGLVSSVSQLTTSTFVVSGSRTLPSADELTLSLSQPLRIEDGEGTFLVPVGRTPDGQVLRSSFTADLEPSARQIDVTAEWRRPLAPASHLGLGVTWSRHPGHDSTARPMARARAVIKAAL